MKKLQLLKKWQKLLILALVLIVVIVIAAIIPDKEPGAGGKTAGEVFKLDGSYDDDRYASYIGKYSDADFNGDVINVDISGALTKDSVVTAVGEYEGRMAVSTDEASVATWKVKVDKAGLYAISVDYFSVDGYGSSIERNVYVDGEFLFEESEGVSFSRTYKDEIAEVSGLTIRPDQIEHHVWNTEYVMDSYGYWCPAMYYYLSEGTHEITFESVKEPMAISGLTLISKDITPASYSEVVAANPASDVKGVLEDGVFIFQAENVLEKNSPTLYGKSENTSTKTQPYSYKYKLINTVGGEAWMYSNQWITWEFEVPQSGYYNLGLRAKQNFTQDVYFNRSLYIDGELPFAEATDIHFYYDDDYQTFSFGESSGEAWKFYLEAGKHTITLKNTIGDMVEILTEADAILDKLTGINLDLLALLSATPDVDRDYQISTYMPETLVEINECKTRVEAIFNAMVEMTGKRAQITSQMEQLIVVLDTMYTSPNKIASNYKRFKDLVGSFGDCIMMMREQPLTIDYFYVAEVGTEIKDANDNFFDKAKSQLMGFLYSFTSDYSVISSDGEMVIDEDADAVTVWIGSGLTGGRDQAMALSAMVQDSFMAETGIKVNLQLVPASTLRTATLAGRGPDIALQVSQTEPVDFALRNSAADLTQFADYDEVVKRFASSAVDPFTYDGGVYALPETMSFPMLFYRTDIMEELGIDVTLLNSWEGIIEILAVLQGQNMNFALPSSGMEAFATFLYQMDGDFYTEDATASALTEKVALDAFEYWMNFYKLYGLPVDYSFENRFRTGEIPIGVSDYTMYNKLSISAPEIKGKWAMIPLPGITQADGTVNNTVACSVQGCMMMESSKNKEAAWEFMKWWTRADVQSRFGEQLEAIMGAAARYNTANIESLLRFSWTADDRKSIEKQVESLKGIRQVPGGYFTDRNIGFAKNEVINKDENAREALTEFSEAITEEITIKRKEFGLKTAE
ncbi:MAG: extracellular solute-binding protein [Lachnospiraceae bacterium]|nr:extracellular solute-binding protein [Lachnospiraceae bacterium]